VEIILVILVIFVLAAIYGFMFTLFLLVLGIGCIVGLPVGIFYGIRNYMLSIYDGIKNKVFKTIMMVISSFIIFIIILYPIAIIYFLIRYYN